MRYNHMIWDFDGTLMDTYPAMAGAFQAALSEIGVSEPLCGIMAQMKISMGHCIQYYQKMYSIDDAFLQRFDIIRAKEEREKIKPFDGVVSICRDICQYGGRNYGYTHRGVSTAYFVEKFGLAPYFTEWITSQNHFPRKPSPAALQYLCGTYGIRPGEALMIGDRDLDILAAKNAGIHACFLMQEGKPCRAADYNIRSYAEMYRILDIAV